ncbi:uncharacterized protein LOC133825832 [Humulus lupulus]|uniref:uncharacterized protein LOC133825832 n=1 Tax=Humulus lupulus TaxID=3486 RepID=UPI002B41504E|nr:uncharacterized protein LOC133825832 [Humulus lupulus]
MNSWNSSSGSGGGLSKIVQKLLRVKHVLKRFSREVVGDVVLDYKSAKEEFNIAQEALASNPSDITLQLAVTQKQENFSIMLNRYSSYLKQQSKIKWVNFSDENSRYFHAIMRKRRLENRITSFSVGDKIEDDYSIVVEHFLTHFRKFMGSSSSATEKIDLNCLNQGRRLSLEQQVSIHSSKSPGLYGFGSGFFKGLWENIGDDIARSVLEFFQDGFLPQSLNETVISLIPKVSDPKTASDYRPIACYELIIFCKGNIISVTHIQEAFKKFCYSTGLSANKSKSHIFFRGVKEDNKGKILELMQMEEGSFPLKYLGVHLRPTKWKASDCGVILDKLNKNLNCWASRNLSFAGRAQLIHSVLLGIRNFWMSIFILPFKITAAIDKSCCDFLWGANGNRSKLHNPSWEKVCLPKKLGGIGFREGKKWNMALMAKCLWAISNKQDCLWVRWINSVYLKEHSIWNVPIKHDMSWYFKKLLRLSQVIDATTLQQAEKGGKFRVKLFYTSLATAQKVLYAGTVWNKLLVPKHRFIYWQILNSQLLTRDHLSRIMPIHSAICPVCASVNESHSHLFLECIFTRKLFGELLCILFGKIGTSVFFTLFVFQLVVLSWKLGRLSNVEFWAAVWLFKAVASCFVLYLVMPAEDLFDLYSESDLVAPVSKKKGSRQHRGESSSNPPTKKA